ncbi:MAG: 2-oxoacid:acceptor oxidoreductase family protein [Phycisphaerae bacterium]
MKHEVLIAGFGGQGILLMGRMLAEAAMDEGLFATWFPSYGPEMRGGTANCTTMFSSEEIGSPVAASYSEVIVMNEPSLERFAPRVRPGGLLLVNASLVQGRCDRTDIHQHALPAGAIARDSGVERASNVVMLGALLGVTAALSSASVEGAVARLIGAKRPDLIEANIRALHAGIAAVGVGAVQADRASATSVAPVV